MFFSILECLILNTDTEILNLRKFALMNELPVIGYPCLREELWDRQGANIASR